LAKAVAQSMLEIPATAYRAMIFVTSVSAAMASIERMEYCMVSIRREPRSRGLDGALLSSLPVPREQFWQA
jgi:hypothetical protein